VTALAVTDLPRRAAALGRSPAVAGVPLVVGGLALGAAVSVSPLLAVAAALGLLVLVVVAVRPVLGVYAVIVLTPLTAGIDRGTLIPVLRPNEAVLGLVAAAMLARWVLTLRSVRDIRLRIDPMLGALLALAVLSSVVPLIWLKLRGLPATADDLLYALVLWKFLIVFLVVRGAHLDQGQVWRALQLSVGTAALISVISLLQTAGFGPVVSLLKSYFTSNENTAAITNSRGSSTLGLPIAVADFSMFNLAIVMGMIWVRRRASPFLVGTGWVLTLGVIGAGEFSGFIGLLVAVGTVCALTRSTLAARFLGLGGVLGLPFVWTVIQTRLAGFQSATGLPVSWTGRLTNLHTYFWPVLGAHHNYLLGVRPAARIVAPHRANGFIWIESGYTWLLWAGGIPLLLAFCWFVVVALRTGRGALRSPAAPLRVVGLATTTAIAVITVLMVFDPHLTYRGVADELFALLALCTLPATMRGHEGVDHVRSA
jgi:hypothetical protein